MIKEYPRQLGNLDGIDAWARNKANQHNLNEDLAAVEEELEELGEVDTSIQGMFKTMPATDWEPIDLDGENIAKANRYRELTTRRDDLRGIRDALDQGDDTQLLLYEPFTVGKTGNELTHAAIAVGNVDTADYVATYVPGVSTTAADMPGLIDDTANLRRVA